LTRYVRTHNAGEKKAFCLHSVPIYGNNEVDSGRTYADAHGRETLCMHTVPICSGTEVDSGRTYADAF
jgi:hypothetical protein